MLSTQQSVNIYQSLPVISQLQPWRLLYNLSRDGCSINSLRDRLRPCQANMVIVIQV